MKYQCLFSEKNKEDIVKLSFAEFAQREIKDRTANWRYGSIKYLV